MSIRLAVVLLASAAGVSASLAQSPRIDSLARVVNSVDDDSVRLTVLRELAFHYIFNESEKAVAVIGEAEAIAESGNLRYSLVDVLRLKGIYHDVTGNRDSGHFYFDKGYRLSVEYGFPDLSVKLLNGLGMNAWNKGQYQRALEYFFEVMKVNETLEENLRISASVPFNNIGLIYQELGQYEKALEYHRKALGLRLDDPALLSHASTSYNNIGICLTHLQRYDEAEKQYREGITIAKNRGYLRQYYDLISNLANTLTLVRRYDEALSFNLEILNNDRDLALPEKFLMNVSAQVAGIYIQKSQPEKAVPYLERGLSLVRLDPEIEFYASDVFRNAAIVSYMMNDTRKGLEYSTRMAAILEEQFSRANANRMAEVEVKYETAMKENEILRLQAAKEEADLKVALAELAQTRKERIMYSVISLAILALVAFYALHRWNRLKWRTEEEQKLNNAIFLSEQHERVRIGRDLHDSIGQKLAVQKMLLSRIGEEVQAPARNDINSVAALLDETVNEVRNISHNLIPHELRLGLIKAIVETADRINDAGGVHIVVDGKTDDLQADKVPVNHQLSVYRIIQEILNNMLRHAGATKISITIGELNNRLELLIRDNGRGMSADKVSDSQGIGWKNVIARTRLISGSLKIDSAADQGTTIQLLVPIDA